MVAGVTGATLCKNRDVGDALLNCVKVLCRAVAIAPFCQRVDRVVY